MSMIVEKLNQQYPEWGLKIDETTGRLGTSVNVIKSLSKELADKKRMEAKFEIYVDAVSDRDRIREEISFVENELSIAQGKVDEFRREMETGTRGERLVSGWQWKDALVDVEKLKPILKGLNDDIYVVNDIVFDSEAAFESYAASVEEAAQAQYEAARAAEEEAIMLAGQEAEQKAVTEATEAFAAAQKSAYDSVRSSVSSSTGLFKQMSAQSSLTFKDMQKNLGSGQEWAQTYMRDMAKAIKYGFDTEVVASFSDGSEASAAKLRVLISGIEDLGASLDGVGPAAADMVNHVNSDFKGLDAAGKAVADFSTEIQTGTLDNVDKVLAMTHDVVPALKTYEEASTDAIKSVKDELLNLAGAYDQAFTSAYNSISSSINAFDKLKVKAKDGLSASTMTENIVSNDKTLQRHMKNIEKLNDMGLDPEILKDLTTLDSKSIATAEKLAKDGQGRIDKMNKESEEFQKNKEAYATMVAEMQTDFSTSTDAIVTKASQSIDEMDLSDQASAAAKKTIGAYISGIESEAGRLQSAMAAVMSASTSLDAQGIGASETLGLNKGTALVVGANASGTMSANPGLSLVGEEGPELVMFGGGEKVYPADETRSILASTPSGGSAGDKTVTININGDGTIKVDKGVDPELVWSMVAPNLKEWFIRTMIEESNVEGERTYAY